MCVIIWRDLLEFVKEVQCSNLSIMLKAKILNLLLKIMIKKNHNEVCKIHMREEEPPH